MKLKTLEQKILLYLDSEEPYSTVDEICEALVSSREKVLQALRHLQKLGLVEKDNNRWVPTERITEVAFNSPSRKSSKSP